MSCRDKSDSYGCLTRSLHWLTFSLILIQMLLAIFMGNFNSDIVNSILRTLHKSLGIVVFFVAVIFIIWRWSNPRPAFPAHMPKWERYSAQLIHVALYWVIVLMPLSGWVMSTAAGHAPNFFWWFSAPLPLIPHSRALAKSAAMIHEVLAWVLGAIAALHILAALKHHFIDKDTVLRKMWKGR